MGSLASCLFGGTFSSHCWGEHLPYKRDIRVTTPTTNLKTFILFALLANFGYHLVNV